MHAADQDRVVMMLSTDSVCNWTWHSESTLPRQKQDDRHQLATFMATIWLRLLVCVW